VRNLPRTILSLSLSASLLSAAPSAFQTSFWNVGQVHNGLGFQELTGANGESVYSLGGTLSIKRKTQSYPLWFNVQPPSISASCSGVDFKGMFGTMVDLDEIQKQFEEAGQSFAWGILVGVIYSLPGIGEIFAKLDEWAKKIQKMLSDSCNAGVSIGKMGSSWVGTKASKAFKGSFAEEKWTKATNVVTDSMQLISDGLNCASKVWENVGSSANCDDTKKDMRSSLGAELLSNRSLTASVLNTIYKNKQHWPGSLTAGNINTIDWKTLGSHMDADDKKDIAFVSLVVSAFGDSVLAKTDAENILKGIKAAEDGNGSASNTTSSKEIADALEAAQKSASYYNKETLFSNSNISSADLIQFLIEGNSVNLTSPSDSNETNTSSTNATSIANNIAKGLYLPYVIYYAPKSKSGTDQKFYAVAIDQLNSNDDSSQGIDSTVTNYISSYAGVSSIAQSTKECYLLNNQSSCAAATGALVDREIVKFFAKVYRNTPSSERHNLEKNYETFVKFELASAIVDKFGEYIGILSKQLSIDAQKIGTSSSSGKATKTQAEQRLRSIKNTRKRLEDFMQKLRNRVDKLYQKKGVNVNQIIRDFKRQDIENIKRAYENNG